MSNAEKNLNDYKPEKFYLDNTKPKKTGFSKFDVEGVPYFCYYKNDQLTLISQPYSSVAGRDNGIESTRKNMKDEKRYRFSTAKSGKHYFGIYARNGQEVASSVGYGTAQGAQDASAVLMGKSKARSAKAAPSKAAPAKASAAAGKTHGRIENYHPLAFYKKHGTGKKDGFDRFSEGDAHYFTYNQGGEIILISESYTSKAGRDNGVKSVTTNMKLADRYEFHQHKNGKHYFDINAANKQEVATSIWYGSAAAAAAGALALRTGKPAKAKAKAAAKKAAPKTKADHDNYHPLAFYARQAKGSPDGIETFKGDDGLYYFTYNENNKIALLSEGYPTAAVRDNGAASVMKNIGDDTRYEYKSLKNGKHDFRLRAGNNKEIARSVWYSSAAAAATGAAYLMGKRKRASIAPAAAVAAAAAGAGLAAAKAKTPKDKDDDYLKCEEYHDRTVTDKANNAALFQHKNGQYYFAIYDGDGDVRLRSEGFPAASKRADELAAVLRLIDNKTSYKRMEKNGYFMDVLYDETGREVGRSCLRAVAAPVAAAAAPVAAAAAPIAAAAASGGGFGWLKWLIPLLLLLGLLLFGLSRCFGPELSAPAAPAAPVIDEAAKADAAAKAEAAAQAEASARAEAARKAEQARIAAAAAREAEAAKAAAATPEPVKPQPAAQVMRTAGLNVCGASNIAIFNVPSYSTPRSISVLGTFPEFGDSHGLTPRGFYDKLASRAAASDFDATYLDYVARSLGYSSFSAMDASLFSEEVLPAGTSGLLGYGEFHGFEHRTLNTSERDREAFRIEGANGKVVHFMKTCGNYMYACQ